MNKKNKTEELENDIEQKLGVIDSKVHAIKDSRAKPTDMSREEYVWLLFSRSIFLQTKDIISLINVHRDAEEKPYAAVYSIFRSILEEYFNFKLLFADKSKLHTHYLAFALKDYGKELFHLMELQKLSKRNMFVPSDNLEMVTSVDGLQCKIAKYEADIKEIKQGINADEVEPLSKIYKNIEQVCIEHDRIKNISSVEKGKEENSLVWQYHYIYRFLCGSVHGHLKHMKANLDILWADSSDPKRSDYLEVLKSLSFILGEIIEMTPQKL